MLAPVTGFLLTACDGRPEAAECLVARAGHVTLDSAHLTELHSLMRPPPPSPKSERLLLDVALLWNREHPSEQDLRLPLRPALAAYQNDIRAIEAAHPGDYARVARQRYATLARETAVTRGPCAQVVQGP